MFLFCPDGRLTAAQHHSLARLAAEPEPLMAVCAAPDERAVPVDVVEQATALLWKGLSGFDFSGYVVALWAIARHSPGADAFVMNDSVLGPLGSLRPFWDADRPDLFGFTGSSAWENHIQSYAFMMREVTPTRLRGLENVLPRHFAFNHFQDVVLWQETRLARVAARRMSVGAGWFMADPARSDLPLFHARQLIEEGFPFVKCSHFGKWRGVADVEHLVRVLRRHGHPEMPQ